MTNARSRIEEFIERVPLAGENVRMLIRFAQRLEIDPYDVPDERDSVGERHCAKESLTKRAGSGFWNCTNYRISALLYAGILNWTYSPRSLPTEIR